MSEQFLTIKRGDADTFTEVITNLSSLSGYSAKMYIYDDDETEVESITGTINGLTVTYDLNNETSKALAAGTYRFETKLWDASDHVYTPSYGVFVVEESYENDPAA
jgi:hypothetical protein